MKPVESRETGRSRRAASVAGLAAVQTQPPRRLQRVVSGACCSWSLAWPVGLDSQASAARGLCPGARPRRAFRRAIPAARRATLVRHGCARARRASRGCCTARKSRCSSASSARASASSSACCGARLPVMRRSGGQRDDADRGHPLFAAFDHLRHRAHHDAGRRA